MLLPVEVVGDNGDHVCDDSGNDRSGAVFIVSTYGGESQQQKAVFRQFLDDRMIKCNLSVPQVLSFLEEFHDDVSSLAERERGETNLVEVEIDTGDAV